MRGFAFEGAATRWPLVDELTFWNAVDYNVHRWARGQNIATGYKKSNLREVRMTAFIYN